LCADKCASLLNPIHFTRPFLPPRAVYNDYLNGIWQRNWLTNDGPLVQALEQELQQYLGVKHLVATANGTLALQFAIRALAREGEIITTPFSYIATATSVLWESCTPVFADVDPADFNLAAEKVAPLIGPKTKAILVTHVFGNPCDIAAFEKLVKGAGIALIFDAAHAFGTCYQGQPVFVFGDATMGSLHATKLYHSVEGGLLATASETLFQEFKFLRNFGHNGFGQFALPGINGKMSELHAAMGLANFKYLESILQSRKEIWLRYAVNLNASGLQLLAIRPEADYNYAYFPVLFPSEEKLLQTMAQMEANEVQPRRYFYPALNEIAFLQNKKHLTPVVSDIARRVLCLPMYHDMSAGEIDYVCSFLA